MLNDLLPLCFSKLIADKVSSRAYNNSEALNSPFTILLKMDYATMQMALEWISVQFLLLSKVPATSSAEEIR
jgi:hypothetical protein